MTDIEPRRPVILISFLRQLSDVHSHRRRELHPAFGESCRSSARMWFALRLAILIVSLVAAPRGAAGLDLLNDDLSFSPFNLELRKWLTMPAGSNNIISMTTRIGDPRMYVTTQEGKIYVINTRGNGTGLATKWFDMSTTGVSLAGFSGQLGLQSTAFHPEFDVAGAPGYGKFYTTLLRAHPADTTGVNYLGNSPHGVNTVDSVLAEWTFDHASQQVAVGSYRELYRVNLPVEDHQIKQARFNPYSKPGDEDYGLLYVTHGDSNLQHSPGSYPQLPGNALGKMLRVNPLQAGASPYSVPETNPYFNNPRPDLLKEIYAFGFRNPHNFSFAQDDEGQTHLLVGDIGRGNIEEVNLISPGGNYGWPRREGTFVQSQNQDLTPNSGYYDGVSPLPMNEGNLDLRYIYPVAQFDHNTNADNTPINEPYAGMAISLGYPIRNGSDPSLENEVIFANFAFADGNFFHANFDEMLATKTTLSPGDLPSQLTQSDVNRLRLSYDHDNNPATAPIIHDDVMSLISNFGRTDTRFGEGVFGEMYISSKTNGTIYLVTNTLPQPGDFNQDRIVDAADYVVWRNTVGSEGYHLAADGDGNGRVDEADYGMWKQNFGKHWSPLGNGGFFPGMSSSVPEPSSAAFVWIALAMSGGALRKLRRRG